MNPVQVVLLLGLIVWGAILATITAITLLISWMLL